MKATWFQNHVAYTMAKFGMSMCVLGMAAEFADEGVAVNALWPRTAIATSAINLIGGPAMMAGCRTVDIMSDAAHLILTRESRKCTGKLLPRRGSAPRGGDDRLREVSRHPGTTPIPDFFVD